MPQGVELIGRSRRTAKAIQEEDFVAGIDERMNGLARHGGAAGEAGGDELRQGDEEIADQGGIDDPFRGAAGHVSGTG